MDPSALATYMILMVLCLIGSAYFSATETAFSAINKTRLKAMAEKGNKRAALVLRLADRYDKLISTILIGNNVVNIAVSSLGTVLFLFYSPKNGATLSTILIGNNVVNIALSSLGTVLFLLYSPQNGATISTVVVTVAVLIFGEITPKSIAKDFPEKWSMMAAPFLQLLIWLLTPLTLIFSAWKKLLGKLLKAEEDTNMTQEELLLMVEEAEQEGGIDEDESNLLKNAIEFTERKAEDILTHRTDLEAVPTDAEKTEVSKTFYETQFSRLLVYEASIDNVVGVIHQKDFYTETGITQKSIREIMTPPLFVQRSEKINDLLQQLQREKSHIAVVLDEYGGTYGIVTMEDILEELVGEIWDEHDEVVEEFKQQGEDSWLVDCTVNIDEFCEFFELSRETEEEAESVSLGGWVMEQLGKVPEEGDAFTYEELEITVTETDFHRVAFVTVLCHKALGESAEDAE